MADGISYVDGVGRIWIHEGVVRMELFALEGQPDGEQPTPRRTQELAITLPNFVRFCLAMTASLQDMKKRGIIRREAGQSDPAGGTRAGIDQGGCHVSRPRCRGDAGREEPVRKG